MDAITKKELQIVAAKIRLAIIEGTFHAFGQRATMSKIDYIFTDMESDPAESYAFDDVPVEGLYVSDHLPVFGYVTVG